jgi:hypothetical protein
VLYLLNDRQAIGPVAYILCPQQLDLLRKVRFGHRLLLILCRRARLESPTYVLQFRPSRSNCILAALKSDKKAPITYGKEDRKRHEEEVRKTWPYYLAARRLCRLV